MNSRASRASRASVQASSSAGGDAASGGLFVVPQTPPRSWSPPPSANFESIRTLDASLLQREDAGRENAFKKVLRRFRVAEFALTAVVWLLSRVVLMVVDVHKRDIPSIEIQLNATATYWARDPVINHKELTEQVTNLTLVVFALGGTILINVLVNLVLPLCNLTRRIPHDTRDFILTLAQAVSMEMLVVNFIKRTAGRLRPCFYDMCGWQFDVVWDGVSNLCTSAKGEKEARQSFPSGHSSLAWSSMLVLTLYLLGRARLNYTTRGDSILAGALTTLKLFLCCIPTLVATWVAVTRTTDNWHHYSDVLAGSIIGAVCALLAYGYNFGSVFSRNAAGLPLQEYHNRCKKNLLEARVDEDDAKMQQP